MYIINEGYAPSDPSQKFYNFEGDICNRETSAVIRKDQARSYRLITNVNELKSTIRAGEYTFPGCYRLFFITSDGASLSFASVLENIDSVIWSIRNDVDDGWKVEGLSGTHECDEDVHCDHSNELIS